MRSLAVRSAEDLGGGLSVVARLRADHARLEPLLDRLPGTAGEHEQELVERLCRVVSSRAVAAEAVLGPALRRHVPGGDALADGVEKKNRQVTELVVALEDTRPGDPDRSELLARTVEVLRQDARDAEVELLPRLQDAVDVGTLRRLGLAWEVVRRTAPPMRRVLRSASRHLDAVAHRREARRVLRSGDRPGTGFDYVSAITTRAIWTTETSEARARSLRCWSARSNDQS